MSNHISKARREKFEAWATANGYPIDYTPDAECGTEGGPIYADGRTHAAWWAYREGLADNDAVTDAMAQLTLNRVVPRCALMVAQDEALRHRAEHDYLPRDRKDAVRWKPHHWIISAIYAYAAQFKAPEDAGDTRRLAWLAQSWGSQRRDFKLHVLERGGAPDLDALRTFVDDESREV